MTAFADTLADGKPDYLGGRSSACGAPRSERNHLLRHQPTPAGAVTGPRAGVADRRAPGLADRPAAVVVSGSALPAPYLREEDPPCAVAGGGPVTRGWRGRLPRRRLSNGAELAGGRCIMSHSGAFYVIKAMEGDAAGGGRGVPGRRAADHRDPAAGRADGSMFSLVQRVLAVVRRNIGGAQGRTGRGRHTLGGAAPTD